MLCSIHTRGTTLPPALHIRITQRVRAALGRLAPLVAKVIVHLDDQNGPRGGPDMRALVRLVPVGRDRGPMVAEHVDGDPVSAVGRAAERAARRLRRLRSRSITSRRSR
ncbi:MAG: HPF/RaiA family ribosome-associated protein [Myxococcales bacterium]|nr:HPF/RaiA family ribosome-associated protein [Myxococcales bacterium]